MTTFGTAEMSTATGATKRQLQTWDELGIIEAIHDGHRRIYLERDLHVVRDLVKLRKAGLVPGKALQVRGLLRSIRVDVDKACQIIKAVL